MDPPAPLQLQPRPSRCLAWWLGGLHGAVLLAVWLAALDEAVRWGLTAGIAGLWVYSGFRYWWRGRGLELVWTAEGHWLLQMAGRPGLVIRDWDAPWVAPALVLLRFRISTWRQRTVALCADSLGAEAHRRLRVRLRSDRGAARNCPESAPSVRAGPDR